MQGLHNSGASVLRYLLFPYDKLVHLKQHFWCAAVFTSCLE